MIIKSISAENFGKFDRYTVNLSDNINVFYGDNEAGKTTLYEIISILLFAPSTDEEMAESNKLIKSDEKYARVYAIINLEGKEISIAREIYNNNTNLSIADQDNVSSLGNVNVPFIGDLTKDMYEAFHTIDYYNMATITNNVWQQIIKVIDESHGAPRVTPDYSSSDEEKPEKIKSSFEDEIKKREEEKKQLEDRLREAQKMQKKMISNQDKIDDLLSELEDVENNIELESSYLKEAHKMNQIRETIKKTQDLTLELEKYKNLKPWMPNLREYYERLVLYAENKANGIENPLEMFDDLERTAAEELVYGDAEPDLSSAEEKPVEEKPEIVEEKPAKKRVNLYDNIKLPSEDDYIMAKKRIDKFIKENYMDNPEKMTEVAELNDELEDVLPEEIIENTIEEKPEPEIKPLEIRKPKDMTKKADESEDKTAVNNYGQTNPYSDNFFPNMGRVNYSGKNMPEADEDDDEDKYSPSSSNDLPKQSKKVDEKDMNTKGDKKEEDILKAEQFLNSINMQEIIAASKETVEVSEEAQEEIDKAKLRYNIIAKRIFSKDVEMSELSDKLKKLDTNVIYKAIVKYKGLAQKQRSAEHITDAPTEKKQAASSSSFALGVVAFFSLLLGLACFFIDQIVSIFYDIEIIKTIGEVLSDMPLSDIIPGNVLSGGAFSLIAVLLIVAIMLGNDKGEVAAETINMSEVELDELKNNIRLAKREVVDSLQGFPIPAPYLDNPNNSIISIINELREAEETYKELIIESTLPKNENYRALWALSKKVLPEQELSSDLFDNIAKIRLKIKDFKDEKAEQDRKLKDAKMRIDLMSSSPSSRKSESLDPMDKFESFKSTTPGTSQFSSGNYSGGLDENQFPGMDPKQSPEASQPSAFGIPEPSNTGNIPPQSEQSDNDTSSPFNFPGQGNLDFSQPERKDYPENSPALGSANNFGYPSDTSGITKAENDTGYPSDGGIFGTPKNPDFSMDTSQFGAAKEPSYPSESPAQPDFGFKKPDIENESPTPKTDDFGIPGINRYSGSTTPETETAFKIPETDQKPSFISEPVKDASEESNDFGIPGIRRYTGSDTQQQPEANKGSDFGIPGINKYSEPVSTPPETEAKPEEENEFGIPGIHRYTGSAPAEEKSQPQQSSFGNLPGIDKFSNRNEQPAEKTSDTPFFVPPSAVPAEAAAAATGAAIASGLPGLDMFSNRNEQQNKPVPAEEQPVESAPVEETPPEESENEFGIPGITKYPAYNPDEQKIEAAVPEIEEEHIAVDEPEETAPVEEAEEPVPVVPAEKDRREKELDKMLEILGDDPESAIREVEDMTRELHYEIIKRDKSMAELLKLNDAAVRLSTLSSNKWPYKQKAIDASTERVDDLEADKLKLKRHIEMLLGKMTDVEYEDTPQAISDRLKTIEEEIEQLKLENDKHAIAEEILEKKKLLDMSSGPDRSYIIDDTSEYMKELTLGKYVQVKINDNLTGLAICDKDGQWFDTTKDRLSQATREQLYLALRVSIADLFDEKSLIFPMFFDEALITWDKRRMKAVMRLLSKMSMHRQVIIFTCHDWLRDMIGDYLIGAKIIEM
ncbi:MAG: AAA family ATPase [Clostridia bacterium]|nr:AAA family ATPase [Clostridia bacterium]